MSDPFVEGAIRRILARRQGDLPGPCPDANEFATYLESRLTPGETDLFEKHASSCAACQATLALSLQLEERESGVSANTGLEPQRFSYRSSQIHLVLATAVVVVVGVLLFQATRQSGSPKPKPQVASQPYRSSVSGGRTAALTSPESSTTSPSTAVPTASPLSPIATETPAQVQVERQPLRSTDKPAIVTAPPPTITLDALNIAKAKVSARADLAKPGAVAEPAADALKAQRELMANNALNMRMSAANSDETKIQNGAVAGQAAQGVQQAGQLAQQAVQSGQQAGQMVQQASQLNQQAAAPPMRAAQAQAKAGQGLGGGGGGGAGGRGGGGAQKAAVAPMRDANAQAGSLQTIVDRFSTPSNYERFAARFAMPERTGERPVLAEEMIAATVKRVGNRVFFRTTREWVDAECGLHLGAPTHGIARNSREYRDILAAEPALAELHASGLPILIYWHGTLCLIQ